MKDTTRKIETGTLFRSFEIRAEGVSEEKRTAELSFSSEEPVSRWFGTEILDHAPGSIRLGRLNNGGALLVNHDTRDQVGVVELAELGTDRKGRAVVRFGKSTRAEEIFQDVKDGVRRLVSVGYRLFKMVLEESDEKKGDTFRVTDWEPFEISLVPVPADVTVGVGRASEGDRVETVIEGGDRKKREVKLMEDDKKQDQKPDIDVRAIEGKAREDARKAELSRIKDISALGVQHDCRALADKAIEAGTSVDDFRGQILTDVYKAKPVQTPVIGMSEKESREYSIVRAIRAVCNGSWKEAGLEKEASDAVAGKMKKEARSFFIPLDVLTRADYLNIGTASEGGNLKATNLLAGSFIDLLRARAMVIRMGARILSGLAGDVAIPRQTGGATCYWLAEDAQVTVGKQAFDQVTLAPKTLAAMTELTRKLIQQSSVDVEMLVRSDLATQIALAIDAAALHGRGSATYNEPTGIAATSGIGSVAGGTNGLAPAWSHVVALWKEVAIDNADFGSLGFLTNAKAIGKMMTVEKASGTAQFLVDKFPDAQGFTSLAGMRCGVSNQVSSTLTKGTSTNLCSAIFFGNWSDLLIGQWGAIDVLVDPYTHSDRGRVRITNFQDVDVAVRHAQSFAAMLDALTA